MYLESLELLCLMLGSFGEKSSTQVGGHTGIGYRLRLSLGINSICLCFFETQYHVVVSVQQDNYLEEAFKMRNLLQEFQKHDGVRYPTILGLREHIFTGRYLLCCCSEAGIPVLLVN